MVGLWYYKLLLTFLHLCHSLVQLHVKIAWGGQKSLGCIPDLCFTGVKIWCAAAIKESNAPEECTLEATKAHGRL